MELENRTRGSCARPANGSLIHLSGSPIADTVYLLTNQLRKRAKSRRG